MPEDGRPKLPQSLLDAQAKGLLIPFVGAGVSMAVTSPSSTRDRSRAYPDWPELLEMAATRLEDEGQEASALAGRVRSFLGPHLPDLLEAARWAKRGLGPLWFEFLRGALDLSSGSVDQSSLDLARAVWGLSDLIITTNYDHVLRWSCPRAMDMRQWPLSAPAEFVTAYRGRVSKPTVWHLHGTIDDPAKMILSPDGYQNLYPGEDGSSKTFYEAALITLRTFMTGRHLLFVGFSLEDEAVLDQLRWAAETFEESTGPHYVLAHKSEVEKMRARAGGLNLMYLPVDGFEQMPGLLREIAVHREVDLKPLPEAESGGREETQRAQPRRAPQREDQDAGGPTQRAERSSQLVAGDLLGGRYRLLEVAGQGGFAEVWRARDEREDVDVAVKVLLAHYAKHKERVERFATGARLTAMLDHPNIVKTLDGPMRDGEHHYYAMEWMPGGNLRDAVLRGTLDRDAALGVLADALEGLGRVHSVGLVHRDVKPGNILIDEAGGGQLADFDLGRDASTGLGTKTSVGMGSLVYAAPELLDAASTADARADVYGAAMAGLFVLLKRDPPMLAVLAQPQLVREAECGSSLRACLEVGMAYRREDRPEGCGQLIKALRGGEVWVRPAWASSAGEDEYGRWAAFRVAEVTQRMRWIDPGAFLMGSPDEEAGRDKEARRDEDDEGPQHSVTLTQGFWLADTPCTQALWEVVMGDNPSHFKDPQRPVEQVSCEDIEAFRETLKMRVPGLHARLPTEAQWEYACRAGTATATYAGDLVIRGRRDAPVLNAIAWYGGNSGEGFDLSEGHDSSGWNEKQFEHSRAGTRKVGAKDPNTWGLYDMLGNVWEWCADGLRSYESGPELDPVGPSGPGRGRAVRGGGWILEARYVRAACRHGGVPGVRFVDLGFRLARGQEGAEPRKPE